MIKQADSKIFVSFQFPTSLHRNISYILQRISLFSYVYERCSIVAGKCEKDIVAQFGYTGTCDSRLFLKWVQEMLVPNLKKNQIVIMDNATIHKSPKIKEAIEKAGCRLVYQPSYSPDFNPIEHFWHPLKLKIESSKQKFDSLFDFMPYVLAK